jgi:hypothetical protein
MDPHRNRRGLHTDSIPYGCDSYTQNAISTRRVCILHEKYDFQTYEFDYDNHKYDYDTHECDLYTLSVTLKFGFLLAATPLIIMRLLNYFITI